jgi:hypothetical protein
VSFCRANPLVPEPVVLDRHVGHLEECLDLELGQSPEVHPSQFLDLPLDRHRAGACMRPNSAR